MKLSFPAWHTHEGAGAYFTPYCSTWASTAWVIRTGKEIDRERETGDRVLELYLQCIITLVFRPGPTEPSFWTWPCISFIFLVISFFSSFVFSFAVLSNRNTLVQCLSGVPSLDFSLQTALHACLGTDWHRQQPDWRVQWQIRRDPRNRGFFLAWEGKLKDKEHWASQRRLLSVPEYYL